MKLSKWLDRELRIHQANVIAKVKEKDAGLWFRLYQNISADLVVARAERDNAREECGQILAENEALQRQIASKDLRIAEAVQEAVRLRAELDKYERATP